MSEASRRPDHDDHDNPGDQPHLPGGPAQRPNTWQHRVKVRLCVLWHELDSVCREADETNCVCGVRASEQRVGARCLLRRAATLIESAGSHNKDRTSLRRFMSWWHGELYEGSLQCLHEAEVLIVSLYEPCRARRHANSVLATVRPLCPTDPRLKAVDDLLAAEPPHDRELPAALAELLEAGYAVEEERAVRSRNFRNRLIRAGFILLVVLGAVLGAAYGVSGSVPVCEKKACLGGHAPSGEDTGLVMLLGMLGAALPMAGRLQRMGGSWNPYSLPFWQEMIKLPIGALTAVTGLLLVGTDWLPLLKDPTSWRQVAAYAVVFGVVQLALTHTIDTRAEKLLAADPDADEAKQLENVPSKKPAA